MSHLDSQPLGPGHPAARDAVADPTYLDLTWGQLSAFQAHGLSCVGCGRSFLETERLPHGHVGPLDAIKVAECGPAGLPLFACQDCADDVDLCEEDGWQTAREFDRADLEESTP